MSTPTQKPYLHFCECGTPLIRTTRFHMTAEAWTRAYESGDPNAKIQLDRHYIYHRWHPSLLQADGTYNVQEDERISQCPACQRNLAESNVTR